MNQTELKKLASMAAIALDDKDQDALLDDINQIISFVETIKDADVGSTAPLFSPLNQHQRLRLDEVCEEACIAELESIAPAFEDDFYLVPKVIEVNHES